MKLYFSPNACSLAVHIVLRDLGTPFTPVRVDTKSHKTESGDDYYAINPKGAVPLLELDGGERLTEGPIIIQYLCDKAGRTDLMPAAGTMARYRVMEWQNYVTSELHKSFTPLFNPAFDDAARTLIRGILRKKYEWVSSKLQGKQYLTGDTFTGADAYLFTVTRWAGFAEVKVDDLEPLQAYMKRVGDREAVRAALTFEKQPPSKAA